MERSIGGVHARRAGRQFGLVAVAAALIALGVACGGDDATDGAGADDAPAAAPEAATPRSTPGSAVNLDGASYDKMALWEMATGPHLRGANIHQARVYPELDGDEFKGAGYVGPPFTQEDLTRLSALGANYVNVSHPGLFTEKPPYVLDERIEQNLDRLLAMIQQADMFAVISFRTGPGRSEFGFWVEEGEEEYDAYLNDAVWEDRAAHDGWVEMWRYAALRYREHPIVVGYDLMVEPNAAMHVLGIYEPEVFYDQHGGSLYDWNSLHGRIAAAVREVDADTPILVGAQGFSAVEWLPYLEPTGDGRTVYMVHQYSPVGYTHAFSEMSMSYPGRYDLDWDGDPDEFNAAWLDTLLETVDTFAEANGVPVAVNEFGVIRFQPGAARFLDDLMGLFEQRGMNHAIWDWSPAWKPLTDEVNEFNFRFGADRDRRSDDEASELTAVVTRYWALNAVRPSNVADWSP